MARADFDGAGGRGEVAETDITKIALLLSIITIFSNIGLFIYNSKH